MPRGFSGEVVVNWSKLEVTLSSRSGPDKSGWMSQEAESNRSKGPAVVCSLESHRLEGTVVQVRVGNTFIWGG